MADSSTCITKKIQTHAQLWFPASQQQVFDRIDSVLAWLQPEPGVGVDQGASSSAVSFVRRQDDGSGNTDTSLSISRTTHGPHPGCGGRSIGDVNVADNPRGEGNQFP